MEENINPNQIYLNSIDLQSNTIKFFESNKFLTKQNFQDYITQVGLNDFWKNNDERTLVWDYINKNKENNTLNQTETINGITSFLNLAILPKASTDILSNFTSNSSKTTIPITPKIRGLKEELEKNDKDTLIQLKRLIIILGLKNKDMISPKEIKQLIGKYSFFTLNWETILQFMKLCSTNLFQIQTVEISRFMVDKNTLNDIITIIDSLCLKDNKKSLNKTINHNDLMEDISHQQQEINIIGIMLSEIIKRTEINEDLKDSLKLINELLTVNKSSQQNLSYLKGLKDICFMKEENDKRDSIMMIDSSINSLHNDMKFLLSKNSKSNEVFGKLDDYISTIKNYVNNEDCNISVEPMRIESHLLSPNKINEDKKQEPLSPVAYTQIDQTKRLRKEYQKKFSNDKQKLYQSIIFTEAPHDEIIPLDDLTNSSFNVSCCPEVISDISLSNNDKSKLIINNPSISLSKIPSISTTAINNLQMPSMITPTFATNTTGENNNNNTLNNILKIKRLPSNQSNNLSQIERDSNYINGNKTLFSSISNYSYLGNDINNEFNYYLNTINNLNIPTTTATATATATTSTNNNYYYNNNILNDNDNFMNYDEDTIPSKYKQSQVINVTKSINIININNESTQLNNNNSVRKSDFVFNNNSNNNNNPSMKNESISLYSSKMKSGEISSFMDSERSFLQTSYDFLLFKNRKDIHDIINDKCSFDIFSDYVYYNQKATKLKLTLIISINSIYLLSNEEKDVNKIKFSYSVKKLKSISISNKSCNIIVFHFTADETQGDLLIEIFKRRELLKYLRNLCRFKGIEKIQIDISDQIKYRLNKKESTLSISANDISSKFFLITANYGNAIKVGYLLLLIEKLFSKSYQERLVALTNIGMIYYDSMNDQSCIIPVIGSEISIGKPVSQKYNLQIYTLKGEKLSFWSKYEEDIQLWYEECILLQKTYEQKLLDDSINA